MKVMTRGGQGHARKKVYTNVAPWNITTHSAARDGSNNKDSIYWFNASEFSSHS
jgi:hypothetical protein